MKNKKLENVRMKRLQLMQARLKDLLRRVNGVDFEVGEDPAEGVVVRGCFG